MKRFKREEDDKYTNAQVHKVGVFFTQCADGVLTLLHLFSHQPADGHQTLCDVAAGFNQAFFGRLPETKAHTKQTT